MTTIGVPYHLDVHLREFEAPLRAQVTITADLPDAEPWERLAHLYERLAEAVRTADAPLVLANDCSTALGVVAGLQRAGLDPAIVWFDAHGDLQTPETTTSGYLGGMPLRLLVGHRPELIADRLALRPVPAERVVLVDARDLDPPEFDYLSGCAIRRVEVADVSSVELPDGPIYLHVDFDVVTGEELPGLLYPVPDGPSLAAVSRAIRAVMDTDRVVAVNLACTWRAGAGAADVVRPHVAAALDLA